ncbi:hypothetical protein [Paenibacillus sp. NPDC055715]
MSEKVTFHVAVCTPSAVAAIRPLTASNTTSATTGTDACHGSFGLFLQNRQYRGSSYVKPLNPKDNPALRKAAMPQSVFSTSFFFFGTLFIHDDRIL